MLVLKLKGPIIRLSLTKNCSAIAGLSTHVASKLQVGVRGVQFSVFDIRAFEREPGKWRAAVRRTNGMPLKGGRKRLVEYVTDSDATSKADAMQMAMAINPRSELQVAQSWYSASNHVGVTLHASVGALTPPLFARKRLCQSQGGLFGRGTIPNLRPEAKSLHNHGNGLTSSNIFRRTCHFQIE